MAKTSIQKPQRVLIASSHELFGQGLRSLLEEKKGKEVEVVGLVSDLVGAITALENLDPDMVIVDYDDERLNRDEFLAHFVEGEKKLRVVLLSLQDGGEAVVYDRRTMAATQIDEWFDEITELKNTEKLDHDNNEEKVLTDGMRRGSMKNLIIAGILVIIVTALLILGLDQVQLLPVSASAQAEPIDRMFALEFRVIAFLFALIVVLMVYSIVVFRRKKGDTTDARHIEGNTKLEVFWTIIPLVTVLYFSYLGAQSLAETQRVDPQAMEVNVIGQQWSWRFEYPEGGFSSTELVLPVNKQALLHLTSNDVIHSFWVPEFRVKQDVLPGGEEFVRDYRITPTEIGDYKVRCAEMCGLDHANMRAPVRVLSEEDFQSWVAEQSVVSGDPVERGARWVQEFGCQACHSIDGTPGVGPSWQGKFGSEETLDDGTSVAVTQDYLYQSICDPGSQIVEGFQNIMPANFCELMSEDQIQDIIAFIESLQ
jgi:cytochrome c oxidase subunit 2